MKNFHETKSINPDMITGMLVLTGVCYSEGKTLNETINYIYTNVFAKVTEIDFNKYYKFQIVTIYNNLINMKFPIGA